MQNQKKFEQSRAGPTLETRADTSGNTIAINQNNKSDNTGEPIDLLNHIAQHQFMQSDGPDFNSEQQKYQEEKDGEYDNWLTDEHTSLINQ